jgi:precorrin-6B methylase 2
VTNSDVLVDVGCGDGRIPIAAAVNTGCTAFGVETDASLVELARRNVLEAQEKHKPTEGAASLRPLSERVKIVHGDARKHDFSTASVVTMYLSHR